MKETKVYVNELPVSCDKCPYHSKILLFAENKDSIYKTDCRLGFAQNCNIKSIKTHDRELVKKVCEKIARNVRVRKIQEEWYVIETDLRAVLDQIEKEFEDE